MRVRFTHCHVSFDLRGWPGRRHLPTIIARPNARATLWHGQAHLSPTEAFLEGLGPTCVAARLSARVSKLDSTFGVSLGRGCCTAHGFLDNGEVIAAVSLSFSMLSFE